MAGLVELDGADFDGAIAGATPLVVEFYGNRCPACQAVAGVLEELAAQPDAAVRFAKVNLDASPEIADRFAIRSVPVLMVFANGAPLRRTTPRLSRPAIRAFVEGTPG